MPFVDIEYAVGVDFKLDAYYGPPTIFIGGRNCTTNTEWDTAYTFTLDYFTPTSHPIAIANDLRYIEVHTRDRNLAKVYDFEFTYTITNQEFADYLTWTYQDEGKVYIIQESENYRAREENTILIDPFPEPLF